MLVKSAVCFRRAFLPFVSVLSFEYVCKVGEGGKESVEEN